MQNYAILKRKYFLVTNISVLLSLVFEALTTLGFANFIIYAYFAVSAMLMNQPIQFDLPDNIKITIKREDLLHPYISGNKFRKLKYNILKAKEENKTALLTFGGAYSNHIAASAAAGKEYGFATIGVIRGEELVNKIGDNPTLSFARDCGMMFKFVSREDYSLKYIPLCVLNCASIAHRLKQSNQNKYFNYDTTGEYF